ncbi:MAG: CHASE domain-containing protein [Pseudomonadota bacterium]
MATFADRLLAAPRPWQAFAITFAAYLVAARLALLLTIPPGVASPLFPAAGIALVAALVWGRATWPAVLLGSAGANLWHAASTGPVGTAQALAVLAIGVGAMLQAGVGAALIKRWVGQPLLLAEPSQLLRFFAAGALLASCVSASIGLVALSMAGVVSEAQALAHWAAWWIGDVLGVLIFAPLTLTLIGHPREEWAPRRWPVGVPLLVVTLLMGLGIRQVIQLDALRQRQAFEREAEGAANAVKSRLLQPLHALEAMRGLVGEADTPDRDTFRRAAAPWLIDGGGLAALGWNERVARSDISTFEAREQAAGRSGFRVFARADSSPSAAATSDAHVIRFIEPLPANAQALGVDTQSIAIARSAIAQATRSGAPVASPGFTLTQGGTGVVLYQAVYRGQPSTAADRPPALRGVVFATLRPDALLRSSTGSLLPTLRLCLLDNEASAATRVLAGPAGCDNLSPFTALHVAPLAVAGRQWDLRVYTDAALTPSATSTWPFALVGLLGASMLGALLMIVTGRARRIEAAVQQRTAELQQRSAELQAEVGERQRTTADLRDSQQRLRNILDHVPIGVAYTDTEGRIREANPKLREMLGQHGGRLAASNIANLLHPEDRPAEGDARRRLLAGEVPMSRWQLRCLTADGRTLWTQVGVSVLRDTQGEAKRMVWVFEDITEHLALEEARRSQRGAEAANKAKSEFLSRMSHELRTPLNAMLGFSQLLELDRRQPLAQHQLEWTGQVRQAGWHLLHMINDTLDLARIESGHVELQPRSLDLAELVTAATALLAHKAEERAVQIDVRLFDQARIVLGDHTRVKQILTNLLSNAIKYNVDGGRVLVSSHTTPGGKVALEVTDTGSGMNAAQLAQLFQPFNRLGHESGPVEGTGIGLVISLRLAELMGGSLHARSNVGEGSTFILELPRAITAPVPQPIDDDAELTDAIYRQRVVHYVEDNETNAEVMRGILALRPQVKLEISTLGLDGLAAIRQRKPSLILLDMHLPDIDGLELLRHLRAHPDTAEIPVIVVSADATEGRIGEALAAGATHYLTKPVNVPQFLAALDEMLEQLDTLFG